MVQVAPCAYGSDLSQLLQIRHQRPIRAHREAHAGNENSVEEALQDCWKALIPNWINQDERFCGQKPIGVGADVRPVELYVMVLRSLLLTQNRIEAFRVKIAVVDLVPSRPQGVDDLAMQGRVEADGGWIGI
jgi:hypothetical protein